MEINKRNRAELKSYFVKNAIPTESNFAELIDGMLNQKDDRFVKLPGDPLSIEAAGDDTSQKKAINFYRNFADPKPDWVLSLNPRSIPDNPNSISSLGFSIGDSTGKSRLFIDQAKGNVGIGTIQPRGQLSVFGRGNTSWISADLGDDGLGDRVVMGTFLQTTKAAIGAHNQALNAWADLLINPDGGNVGIGTNSPGQRFVVEGGGGTKHAGNGLQNGGNIAIKGSSPQIDFIDTDHKDWAIHVNSNKMYFIREPWEHTDLVLDGTGNVGIGTVEPATKLQISGGSDAALATPNSGFLIIGNPAGQHLAIDDNEILSKANGNTSSSLSLQWEGGDTYVGGPLTIRKAGSLFFENEVRQMINLWGTEYGIGIQNSTQYFRTAKNFAWYMGGSHDDKQLNAGGGTPQMVIKNGKVGIGTNNPDLQFEVHGYSTLGFGIANSHFPFSNGWAYVSGKGIIFRGDEAGGYAERMRIAENGYVGIGTTAPKAPLHIATTSDKIRGNNFRNEGGHNEYWSIGCFEWVGAWGFRSWSDARVKKNSHRVDAASALDVIDRLNFVDYQHIPEYRGGGKGRGLFAQEVLKVLPNAVATFPEMTLDDGNVIKDFLSVDYNWVFVTGMAAIQELKQQNERLRDAVSTLQDQIARLAPA